MKRIILSILGGTLCMFLVILALATNAAKKEAEPAEHTHVDYVSALQGECFLCGDGSDPITSHYWGEDNVGIINLNTFELLRLEINRYNDHGQLLEDVAGYMQSSHLPGEDSYVHAFSFPDNGYAYVQMSGVQYMVDRTTIQRRLCQNCLNSINNLVFPGIALAEYALISFSERTIYPLSNCHTHFTVGHYDINCTFQHNNNIRIVINYYPAQKR